MCHREGSKVKDLHLFNIYNPFPLFFYPAHFHLLHFAHLSYCHLAFTFAFALAFNPICTRSYIHPFICISYSIHIHIHACIHTCTILLLRSSYRTPWQNSDFICQFQENPMHRFLIQPIPHRSVGTSRNSSAYSHVPPSRMTIRR